MTEFITRNYGQKEFEVIIKTDSKEHYKATEDFARRLIDHVKPQTNADRIRAMSDEELAKSPYFPCPYDDDGYGECKYGWHNREQTCEECKLEWLQQPADKGE